jgi:hypothetical protein
VYQPDRYTTPEHGEEDERDRVFHHQMVDAPARGPTDPESRANMDALLAAATPRPRR